MAPPSSSKKPASSFFIVTTSQDKPDEETRKFIRSHVMRGKNTRKAKFAKQLAEGSGPTPKADRRQRSANRAQAEEPQVEKERWSVVAPRKIASELSLFTNIDGMKPYMFELLHRAVTIVKPSAYTVEVVLVDGPRSDMFCFSAFPQNPALLHSLLFTAQAFGDMALGIPFSNTAQFHLAKTLQHLQKSLANEEEATANSTMVVVLSLASAAAVLGDLETVRKHMDGLTQMIKLRGGIQTFEPGSVIEHKTERIDFGLALANGKDMRFMPEKISWSPQVAHGVDIMNLPELTMIQPRPDPRLLHIWADLRFFAKSANEATKTAVRMPHELFSIISSSIPFRLLSLRYDATSLPELMRLCMLAFMKSVLIQIDGLGPQLRALADALKVALLAQQQEPLDLDLSRFLLWALYIAELCIFENFDQDWLRIALVHTISALGLHTWSETRGVLKGFLWIDLVFNHPGQKLFEQLTRPDGSDY